MLPKSTLYTKLHIVQQGYVTGIIRRRQPLRAVNDRKLTNPRQLHQRKCHLKKNICDYLTTSFDQCLHKVAELSGNCIIVRMVPKFR